MRERPVKSIIRDALNLLKANEYIWYIVKNEYGEESLICDLTGAHFNTLTRDQQQPRSVNAQTYQQKYKRPSLEKAESLIDTIVTVQAFGSMTGLVRCQAVIHSKIFTFKEGDNYEPKDNIIKLDKDLNQLYLEFPLKDCCSEVAEPERCSALLSYLSKKLQESKINLKTPLLTDLASYEPTIEPEQSALATEIKLLSKQESEDFELNLVRGYRQFRVENNLDIKATQEQLIQLAKKIIIEKPMDQWIKEFEQRAQELEPATTLVKSPTRSPDPLLPTKLVNHYGATSPPSLFSGPSSAFTPIAKSLSQSKPINQETP